MKIGVITFWQSKDNYGQHLQSFALQIYLKKLGHEPFLIRFKENQPETAHFQLKNLGKYLKKIPTYVHFYFNQRKEKRKVKLWQKQGGYIERNLQGFLEKNIVLTPVMSEEDLLKNPPIADAYICGSDQIWGGPAPYYLSFVPDEAIKIAYAPSLGGLTQFTPEYEHMMKLLLERFDFIGMREMSGVEVCHRLGFTDAIKVVDPTLLLWKEDYDKIRCNIKKDKPYAFVYLLGNSTTCSVEKIMRYIEQKNLDCIYVASQQRVDKFNKLFVTMEEWIGYLANASLVITNSFHCTVFSLIYHRPFLTLSLNKGFERMNTRVEELLAESKLSELFIDDELFDVTKANLDFSYFDAYRIKEENRSRAILSEILN